jgi:hypothetical protein
MFVYIRWRFQIIFLRDEILSPGKTILAGASSGVSFWLVALPMDTIKSCYQTGLR